MTLDSYDVYYELTLDEKEEALLEASTEDELAVFFLLLKDGEQNDKGLKENVHGPVIINLNKQKGIPKVIERSDPVVL